MSIPARASIVVLHGAMGSATAMEPLVRELERYADVRAINMLGHGGRPLPQRMSIPEMADDVLAQIGSEHATPTFAFGYSAGALVALHLALRAPQRFAGVCTLAAKYVFDKPTVTRWTHLANPQRLKRPELNRLPILEELHGRENWMVLAEAVCRMFREWELDPPLTPDDLRAIALPAMMFCSDNDQLVSLEESRGLGALVPNSRVVLFRGQSHPLEVVPVAPIARAIGDWMREVTSQTASART